MKKLYGIVWCYKVKSWKIFDKLKTQVNFSELKFIVSDI